MQVESIPDVAQQDIDVNDATSLHAIDETEEDREIRELCCTLQAKAQKDIEKTHTLLDLDGGVEARAIRDKVKPWQVAGFAGGSGCAFRALVAQCAAIGESYHRPWAKPKQRDKTKHGRTSTHYSWFLARMMVI